MQELLRINKLAHVYAYMNRIHIRTYKKHISVPFSELTYSTLIELWQIYCFEKSEVESSLGKHVVRLLLEVGFFISVQDGNSGVESWEAERYMHNPSPTFTPLADAQLRSIYNSWELYIDSLWWTSLKEYEYMPVERENSKLNDYFENVCSTRFLKKEDLPEDINDIEQQGLALLKNIFSPNAQGHYKYGSWGGLYSIFPLCFTRQDVLYSYDHRKKKFFYKKIPWLYNWFIQNCLIGGADNVFSMYNFFILLVADTRSVYKKYGNRGFKHFYLESWAIWALIRLFSAVAEYKQIELQWYREEPIYNVLEESQFFTGLENIMITHLLALRI